MERELLEYVDNRGLRLSVDAQQGVLRGVKILGLSSQNGNRYLPVALERAVPLYENAKVHINHPPRGQEHLPRDYRDRLGRLASVELHAEGLFGELHFNPRHPLAEQLLWEAEHAPANVGLSHNARGRGAAEGETFVVNEIVQVRGVDLVSEPASTHGLFEAVGHSVRGGTSAANPAAQAVDLSQLTLAQLQATRPDLLTTLSEAHQHSDDELRRWCRLAQLPSELITGNFLQTLRTAADPLQVLEEQRTRLTVARPQSRSAPLADPSATHLTAAQFVSALRS